VHSKLHSSEQQLGVSDVFHVCSSYPPSPTQQSGLSRRPMGWRNRSVKLCNRELCSEKQLNSCRTHCTAWSCSVKTWKKCVKAFPHTKKRFGNAVPIRPVRLHPWLYSEGTSIRTWSLWFETISTYCTPSQQIKKGMCKFPIHALPCLQLTCIAFPIWGTLCGGKWFSRSLTRILPEI